MFSFSKSARVVLAAAIVLSMSGCTRSISQVDNAGHTANPVFRRWTTQPVKRELRQSG